MVLTALIVAKMRLPLVKVFILHETFRIQLSLSTVPQMQKEKIIIAARVLVGNKTLGNSTMLEPGSGYDCSVNNTTDPSIFVIYKDLSTSRICNSGLIEIVVAEFRV